MSSSLVFRQVLTNYRFRKATDKQGSLEAAFTSFQPYFKYKDTGHFDIHREEMWVCCLKFRGRVRCTN